MSDRSEPDLTVDTLGQPCPVPVIELAKAVRSAEVGTVVDVLSDDPASKVDIPVWCRMQRQRFVAQQDLDAGGWRYTVEKTREMPDTPDRDGDRDEDRS